MLKFDFNVAKKKWHEFDILQGVAILLYFVGDQLSSASQSEDTFVVSLCVLLLIHTLSFQVS